MNPILFITLGTLLPLAGTTLGAAAVFLRKKRVSAGQTPLLCGLAAGVMLAASFYSLLLPAAEQAVRQGVPAFLPVASGFAAGGFTFWLTDLYLNAREKRKAGRQTPGKREELLSMILAVTLHNLPEGMAVGVALAGALQGSGVTYSAALALTAGIALQNFPEGAIISLPLYAAGKGRNKSFLYGFLSGTVEPVGAGLTLLFTAHLSPVLPLILAFAAGAMVYVVASELIPSWSGERDRQEGNAAFLAGFLIMMILDLALG